MADFDGPSLPPHAPISGPIGRAIREHDRVLVRWLTLKFGDVETARDIAQSTYLRVWRYAQTQPIQNLQALIFKTAANLAANEFRARKRRRAISIEANGVDVASLMEAAHSREPTPEATAIAKQEIGLLMDAIGKLPAQVRRAFILSRFEEKPYREIALIMGVSESSVEKYIIMALRSLRGVAGPKPVEKKAAIEAQALAGSERLKEVKT